jgi:hypothetical protein
MAIFCPRCYHPLDEDPDDDGRLCTACRWFGDKSEICENPPAPTELELAFAQLLAMYRDVCRLELLAEQLAEGNLPAYNRSLVAIRARVAHARHSIQYLFRETKVPKDGEEGED